MRFQGRGLGAVAVAVSLLASGCVGSRIASPRDAFHLALPPGPTIATGGTQFVVTSDDNARAAATLAALMVEHPELGFRVLVVGSDGLGVARGPYKYVLQPRVLGPGRPSKLVVKQLYAVKDQFVGHDAQLAELCFEVDTTMRFLHASVMSTPRGPLFVARSELPFNTVLPLDALGRYLDDLKRSTLAQGAARLTRYLK